ncbi:DUF5953 family protein [Melittangium boletus]|uniref:DUF5953 family protein n=1 Tax=Melittangium boletus TaxID=83453 RepID=UPI003DA338EE
MSFAQNALSIHVCALALTDDDHRPVEVVHEMERAAPGLRLDWTVADDHQLRPLPQRDAWLARSTRNGGFPLVCNHDESHPVTLFGVETPAILGPGGHALFEVHAELPLEASVLAVAADLLEGIAKGACALWGHATPFRATVEIAEQTATALEPRCPPRGLPALKRTKDLGSPRFPPRLGWLNYWSDAAARAIGFPDPARDAALLSRARHTATGGWIVQLTEAPLDLDNPAHLDALKRAYERFPGIGGRSTP